MGGMGGGTGANDQMRAPAPDSSIQKLDRPELASDPGDVASPLALNPAEKLEKPAFAGVETEESSKKGKTLGRSSPAGAPAGVVSNALSKAVATNPARETLSTLLLDHPRVHRILILADALEAETGARLGKIVRDMPRKEPEYARLSLLQGVVVDPDHPDRATVYAMVVEEDELNRLRDLLKHEFQDNIALEADSEPRITAQLAQVGDLAVFQGEALARLEAEPPGELMAHLSNPVLDHKAEPGDSPGPGQAAQRPEESDAVPSRKAKAQFSAITDGRRGGAKPAERAAADKQTSGLVKAGEANVASNTERAKSDRTARDLKASIAPAPAPSAAVAGRSSTDPGNAFGEKPGAESRTAENSRRSLVVLVWVTTRKPTLEHN